MSRRAARGLHLGLILLGALLYLVFVLPRWWVLTGDIPSGVALAGRLAAGIPIALAALPVFAILRDALSRKAKTPELALRLRAWSAVLHLVAGGLIVLAAVVEIWLHLGVGGPYLFAVYGAAGSIAILAVLALYLSFVAEKPPAEPKPPKPKKVKAEKTPRGKKGAATETVDETVDETVEETAEETETVDVTVETDEADLIVETEVETVTDETAAETTTETTVEAAEAASTGLRNKRPAGRRLRRLGR